MTRVGGLVLIAGGLLGIVVAVFAEGAWLRTPVALGLSGATLLLALGYLVAGGRLPEPILHAGPPMGSLLVTAMVYVGGGEVTSAALAMPYMWIAMYAGYFHSARYMAGVVTLGALGHAAALLALGGPPSWPPIWLYAAATSALVGTMVHYLVARLRDLAATDALTGLPNRREWDERVSSNLSLARRLGYGVCVAMLDVDDFKEFNDSRGHAAGDEALRSIARAGHAVLRSSDLLARVGGDEFALLLPGCDPDGAHAFMERLRGAMVADVTLSAGVSVWDGDEGAEALMRRADAALYRAKRMGRDRVEFADGDPLREVHALST